MVVKFCCEDNSVPCAFLIDTLGLTGAYYEFISDDDSPMANSVLDMLLCLCQLNGPYSDDTWDTREVDAYCKENGIKHIFCEYNPPFYCHETFMSVLEEFKPQLQSNGMWLNGLELYFFPNNKFKYNTDEMKDIIVMLNALKKYVYGYILEEFNDNIRLFSHAVETNQLVYII